MHMDRDGEDEEPVFELGPETDTEDDDQPVRRRMPLDTLLTPDALALAGLVLALLAALSPFSNLALIFVRGLDVPGLLVGRPGTLAFSEEGPSKVWLLGPPAGQAGAGMMLGLVSWWRAMMQERDVPRLAGAAVVIAATVIAFVAVVWAADPGAASPSSEL